MSTPSAIGKGWIDENAMGYVWHTLLEIQAHIPCGMMERTIYPGEREPVKYSKREVKAIVAHTLRMQGMGFDVIARTRGINVTSNYARELCKLGKILASRYTHTVPTK